MAEEVDPSKTGGTGGGANNGGNADPGAGGGKGDEWGLFLEQAPEEYKKHPDLKGKATLGDLIKEHLELKKSATELQARSKDFVKKPGDDAKPEEVQAYRDWRGVPKDVSGYDLKSGEDFSKLPGSKDVEEFYKSSFLEAGLTPKEAATAWKKIEDRTVAGWKADLERSEKAKNDAFAKVKEAWKGDHETRLAKIVKFAKEYHGEATWAKIEASGLGNDLDYLESLLPVAEAYGEGKIRRSGGSGSSAETNGAKRVFSSPNFK